MIDSRWYYGVMGVMLFEVVGFGLIALASLGDTGLVSIGTGLFGAMLVVVSLLLLPLFAVCLYLDAKAVREANESWNPDPRVWALGAVAVQLVAISATQFTLYIFIGSFYLFRRFHSSPAAAADEDAWAEQEAQWEEEANTGNS